MLLYICLLLVAAGAQAKMVGAPDVACDAMTPQHIGASVQTGSPPYTLTMAKNNYSPNEVIKGKLAATPPNTFKGFFIQPRRADGSTVGTLVPLSNGMRTACKEGVAALTHTNNTLKAFVDFEWLAPDKDMGNVIFTYSVVKDYMTFWVKLTAPPMAFNTGAPVVG